MRTVSRRTDGSPEGSPFEIVSNNFRALSWFLLFASSFFLSAVSLWLAGVVASDLFHLSSY